MRFYIIFCTNVMSGLPLLLDFLLPPFRFKVQSSAISHPFWTFSCTPPLPRSNPPLFLAPFGLPRASPPPQSPILRYFSLLLDFRVPPLRLKVQSSALFSLLLDFRVPPLRLKVQSSAISRSFWTSSCLSSASKSNPPLFLAPFGHPPASPPLQSPILRSFSLLLDFRVPPLRFKVQSTTLPLPTTQKRRIAKQSASLIPPILIRQSNSTISMPVISQFHQVKHLQ